MHGVKVKIKQDLCFDVTLRDVYVHPVTCHEGRGRIEVGTG
jgi:hypothetical protein